MSIKEELLEARSFWNQSEEARIQKGIEEHCDRVKLMLIDCVREGETVYRTHHGYDYMCGCELDVFKAIVQRLGLEYEPYPFTFGGRVKLL